MTDPGPAHESILLLTLEEVSQLVAHSRDSGETLANIVALIQGRFRSDVCSVYVLEPEREELVLGATIGLSQESVGRLRMRRDEGLTGLVATNKGPVMVADAFRHPRFKYFPEAGEDPYHSFLGVPLIEGGTVQGVLVIQNREVRTFSNDEVRLLVTVAAQLAPLVSNARLLRQLVTAAHAPRPTSPPPCYPTSCLTGVALSPGLGTGDAYLVNGFVSADGPVASALDRAAEERRLAAGMEAARAELAQLSRHISELVGEDHGAILQAQLMILQDREVEQDVTGWLAAGCAAETALVRTLDKYIAAFAEVKDPFFRERVYDIKDVFRRVLWHLRPTKAGSGAGLVVLVAHEASVLDLFSVDRERLAGVVVEHGGPQSHAAILARSLGVPMVGQVAGAVARIKAGLRLRVDGAGGTVQLDPPDEPPPARPAVVPARPIEAPSPAAALSDQIRPLLLANVNLLSEVAPGIAQGAAGVGLYRTEFLFLARRTFPTEEEQLRLYRKLLELLAGRPATIRTFDLRPDKLAAGTGLTAEAFRAFDWRRVLESPPLQQLFKEQIRAILRAGAHGPARILIPLVSHTEQLSFVCETIAKARAELREDGLAFGDKVPLGAMIEVAAAAALVPTWADRVDYFALGTNDLIATALGLDRNDPVGTAQDDLLHPGILRIIEGVIVAAHRAGKPVTVCGEMASDPDGALTLAALGVDSLSVAVDRLSTIARRLIAIPAALLAEQAPALLALPTAALVRAFFQDMLHAGSPLEPVALPGASRDNGVARATASPPIARSDVRS
ncbi:hypothetical protein AYO44_06410 [Planctomycetaceae bacterium SCGC AG-212-F19]|nr:hypothetical protein AYO44_06410 [Planctomycetaceae bacterium SCGC AG-212-F19]